MTSNSAAAKLLRLQLNLSANNEENAVAGIFNFTYHRLMTLCKYCHENFSSSRSLIVHYEVYHREGLYQCPLCKLVKKYRFELREHLVSCTKKTNTSADQINLPILNLLSICDQNKQEQFLSDLNSVLKPENLNLEPENSNLSANNLSENKQQVVTHESKVNEINTSADQINSQTLNLLSICDQNKQEQFLSDLNSVLKPENLNLEPENSNLSANNLSENKQQVVVHESKVNEIKDFSFFIDENKKTEIYKILESAIKTKIKLKIINSKLNDINAFNISTNKQDNFYINFLKTSKRSEISNVIIENNQKTNNITRGTPGVHQ